MVLCAAVSFCGALLLSGCRKEDPFYARNRALIALLDAHERESDPAEKYVLKGKDGHLFYLEDLRAAVVKWPSLEDHARLIGAFADSLKGEGVSLLVVPVPTKVEIYPELLGGRASSELSPSKNHFLKRLDELGVAYLDLRGEFFRAKGEKRIFPRTDSHWDQDAIRMAARAIAAWKRAGRPDARGPVSPPPPIDTVVTGFQGDLAVKFGLDAAVHSDTLALSMVADAAGNRFREPEEFGMLLYGDSFLNQFQSHSAHLGAHLSRETGSPVRSVYSLNAFAKGPAKISAILAANPKVNTAVWVFTSRTLMEAPVAGR